MKKNVELWMSDHLDIPLALLMDPGSNVNSVVIVML